MAGVRCVHRSVLKGSSTQEEAGGADTTASNCCTHYPASLIFPTFLEQVKSAVRRAHWGTFLENFLPSRHQKGSGTQNMELDEDCTLSDWEAMLELDEALALWVLQGPARGEWGWEWGWAASDLQDPEWDSEEIPAVSRPQLVSRKHRGGKR